MRLWFRWEPWYRVQELYLEGCCTLIGGALDSFPAISKNNSKVLTGDFYGNLHFCDIQSGKELWKVTPANEDRGFWCVLQFSEDEQVAEAEYSAYWNQNEMQDITLRYDLKTGKQTARLKNNCAAGKGKNNCARFDEDIEEVYSSNNERVITGVKNKWRLKDPKTKGILAQGDGSLVTFGPDGHRFATTERRNGIKIFDSYSGKLLAHIYDKEIQDVIGMRFSEDGHILVVGQWGSVSIYSRRCPEYWWGIAWLPEFWLALIFLGPFVWSVRRDWRDLRRPKGGE